MIPLRLIKLMNAQLLSRVCDTVFVFFFKFSLNHSFVFMSLCWECLRGNALGTEVKRPLLHLMKPRPCVASEVFPGLIETDSLQING